jgi:uncharacterized protein
MKLSRVERWILANQYLIMEKVEPDEAAYYAKAREAIQDGYEFEYDQLAQGILDEPHTMSDAECREVIDILAMFSALRDSYDALTDKSGIDEGLIKFIGFSGNDETKQMGYANYFCNSRNAFQNLDRTHDFNSHMPLLPYYRKMLVEWKKEGNLRPDNLSKEAIGRITSVSLRDD